MTDPIVQERILTEFGRESGLYNDLAVTVSSLLENMFHESDVQLHSISQRCKSPGSLAGKLAKPEKEYTSLLDITDLAAIRVTTYFAEDVDRVAEIIERELEIDIANSIDKRKLLEPDRFGYQSLHYVAAISDDRCRFIEYSRFADRKFEIQVRSILQHAWAEIEHDLGYKSAAGVPREIRRRFSRIAGLLELADDEFSEIRRELAAYSVAVTKEIQEQPQNVGIDNISLQSILSSESSSIRRLSQTIALEVNAPLEPASDNNIEHQVSILTFLDINTIAALEQTINAYFKVVVLFAQLWTAKSHFKSLNEGIGILYLAYVIIAEKGDHSLIQKYIEHANFGGDKDVLEERIISTYKEAIASP